MTTTIRTSEPILSLTVRKVDILMIKGETFTIYRNPFMKIWYYKQKILFTVYF